MLINAVANYFEMAQKIIGKYFPSIYGIEKKN